MFLRTGIALVLLDFCSRELGRWAQEANGWVQPDGTPIRFSPTHWKRLLDAPLTDDETEQIPDDETEQTQKRPLTRLILALVTAIVCIGGSFWIGSEHSASDSSAANLQREFSRKQDRASLAVGDLTAAREREKTALAVALESKRIANSKQLELKQALDESEKKALALERENTAQKRMADASQMELKQALDESEKRALALERENAAQKQNADGRQMELKRALDETEKRALVLEREKCCTEANCRCPADGVEAGARPKRGQIGGARS